ncbi:MAG: protein kinase domain-containing protein, partial [Microcystaceae cyanobacterium]
MLCSTCLADNPDHVTECQTCGAPLNIEADNDTTLTSALLHLPPGCLLNNGQNGQYEIKSLLGQGGFGITYKGIYVANGAEIAIKELWPQGARQGKTVTWPPSVTPQEKSQQIHSFLIEAANQYKCKHSNIAQIYDYFQENNTAYIVLQFIPGKSLFKMLEEQKRLDESKVKKYFLQIADALQVVHNNNFMHRDIKPDNILIDGNDNAILIDFGAAREFIAGQTKRLTVLLTPGYAPLEQYTTQSKRYPATDIYAFCASMYELLTGELPVDAVQRNQSSPDPLIPPRQINPNISELMERVILTGMKVKITERFQTADDLIDALNGRLFSPSQRQAQKLVKEGKLNDAVRTYANCLRDDPKNKSAAIEYALVAIHVNESQAELASQAAIQLDPQDGRGYGVLGLINCRQGNWQEAVKNLQKAASLSPDQVWILANYAWALGKLGKWGEAEKTIQIALNLDSNCSFALGIQAWILFQQQKYKPQRLNEPGVIPSATKAIALANGSDSEILKRWLYPYLITALSRVTHPLTGGTLNNQITKCLQQMPDHAFVLAYKGWQQFGSGQSYDAIAYFQQASQDPSAQAWVLIDSAIIQEYLGNTTEAIEAYKLCTQKIAQFAFAHYRLGTLLGRSQLWEQAKVQLNEAIKLNPEYAEAYHNRGWVLLNQKTPEGEVEAVREV